MGRRHRNESWHCPIRPGFFAATAKKQRKNPMNPELIQIFRDALDVAPTDLPEFLAARCANAAQRAEVEALLAELEQDPSPLPLEPGVLLLQPAPTGSAHVPEPDRSGQIVGPFRLLHLLGSGGMGAVWLAERVDDFAQKVAIKWAHAAGLSEASRARFANERQLLGRLNHPGIAHIVDGGSDRGVLWYAMEYVDGQPLDDYVKAFAPALDARLRLMLALCDAVQYAHQHLVVHRDLKPANIMVLADGRPKLLDFGIAKQLDGVDGLTQSRAPLTFAYAAPEQIRGDAVTTATDIYALGVTLFELLTVERPHKPRGDGSLSLLQAITDTDAAAPSSVSHKNTTGAAIRATQLKGDLDTIVLKALQRDPTRRYASAQALADDLQRFLDGRPIAARPESTRYRISKFIRRNKLTTALAASTVIAMVAGTTAALHQRDVALGNAGRAEATKNFILKIFTGADAWDTSQNMSAVELTLRGLDEVQTELGDQPEARIELYATIAEALGRRLPTRNALKAGRLLSQELNALPGAAMAQRVDAEIDIVDYLSGAEDFPEMDRQIARIETIYAKHLSIRDRHRLLYAKMFQANVRGQYAGMRALLLQSKSLDRDALQASGLDMSKLDCRELVMDIEALWQERQDRAAVARTLELVIAMARNLRGDDLNRGAFLWHAVGTLLRAAPSEPALALTARVSRWTDDQFGADSEYRSRIDFHDLVRLRQSGELQAAEILYARWMQEWSFWPEEFVIERRQLQYQGALISLAQRDFALARERFGDALGLAQTLVAGHPASPAVRSAQAGLAYLSIQEDAAHAQRPALEAIERQQAVADDGDWWQSATWLAAADLRAGNIDAASARLTAIAVWHERRGARFDSELLKLYALAGMPQPAQPAYDIADILNLGSALIADAERIRIARTPSARK
jgi:eukaryotic-like serine/threonine-protein kinase